MQFIYPTQDVAELAESYLVNEIGEEAEEADITLTEDEYGAWVLGVPDDINTSVLASEEWFLNAQFVEEAHFDAEMLAHVDERTSWINENRLSAGLETISATGSVDAPESTLWAKLFIGIASVGTLLVLASFALLLLRTQFTR